MAIAFGLSFLLMLWAISTANAFQHDDNDPYRVEEFTVNGAGNLNVSTSGGHISVEGSNSNQVRVEMIVTKNGRTLTPDDTDLSEFDIRIEQDGNTVYAEAERENGSNGWKFWKNNNTSISFVVYTPQNMSTDLKTSGGHIEVSTLEGNQKIKTSGGHLSLANLNGTVDAKTSGGHIEISNSSGQLDARTSGGHIDAKDIEGTLNVRTSGGHIDLENIAGTVEASTSGGSISANITEMGEFARLRTSGGNISIVVPSNMGLDLDLRGSRVRTQLENFSGNMEDDDIEGSINGGGPMISARTSGGSVRLSFN